MIASTTKVSCYHCGDTCLGGDFHVGDKYFCCSGCKAIYSILNENDLCEYYDLNKSPGISRKSPTRQNKFAFLDDPEIASSVIQFSYLNHSNCTFYIPQMHCSSCLWILENLHRLEPGITTSRVNFEKKELFLSFDSSKTSLRSVVELLNQLAYEPHIEIHDKSSSGRKSYSKTMLYKLGIAGFCFSNIMMLSFTEYLSVGDGVSPILKSVFRWVSIGLSLPVLCYCSSGIFKSAYSGLRNRLINIDLPVAAAVVITFLRSLYDIVFNLSGGYLDSMSGIVFFILIGRWLQNKTYENVMFERNYKSYFPIAVDKRNHSAIVPVQIDQIEERDELLIHHNEIVPVDALLSKGEALIDYSFVTGESIPVPIEKGEIIYAGGRQTQGIIEVLAIRRASQNYLTSLWNSDHKAKPSLLKKREDAISRYFTFFVLLLGVAAAAYWYMQSQQMLMWNALTTILIVACPCALLMASNFTNGYVIGIMSKNCCYIKHADILQKLQNITHIVFDKTGTLTKAMASEIAYKGEALTPKDRINIASLLRQSLHPVSRSVLEHLNIADFEYVNYYKETPGKGIEGWIDEKHYKLGSESFILNQNQQKQRLTSLYISVDNLYVGKYELKNKYREGIFEMVSALKNRYAITILSGDYNSEKAYLEQLLGKEVSLFFEQTPEDKLRHVESLQAQGAIVLMVGDGLNDAPSLKQSDVGISISEDNNVFTPSADVVFDAHSICKLSKVLHMVRYAKYVVGICFIVSIIYNLVGLYYAMQGTLKPIIAAILMMFSSFSILLLSYGLTQFRSKKIKLL